MDEPLPDAGVLPRLPMSKALKTLLADVTGKPCELRRIPRGPDKKLVDAPFTILYPLWSSYSGPPFGAPHADAVWTYQATITAKNGDQYEWMYDRVIRAVVGRQGGAYLHPLVVEGMSVTYRDLDADNADIEPNEKDDLMSGAVRFVVGVTPA